MLHTHTPSSPQRARQSPQDMNRRVCDLCLVTLLKQTNHATHLDNLGYLKSLISYSSTRSLLGLAACHHQQLISEHLMRKQGTAIQGWSICASWDACKELRWAEFCKSTLVCAWNWEIDLLRACRCSFQTGVGLLSHRQIFLTTHTYTVGKLLTFFNVEPTCRLPHKRSISVCFQNQKVQNHPGPSKCTSQPGS